MPRKKEPSSLTERGIFPSRLRGIMEESHIAQAKLAQAIGMRPQTVSLYVTGQSFPDVNTLRKIAEYLDVSADYLIGLSDIKKPDADLRAVAEYTGLSEKALQKLAAWHRAPSRVKDDPGIQWIGEHMLSRLVETKEFDSMIDAMTAFLQYGGAFADPSRIQEPNSEEPNHEDLRKFYHWVRSLNMTVIDRPVVQEVYLQRAADDLKEAIRQIYKRAVHGEEHNG